MAIITRKSKKGTNYQVKLRDEKGAWVTETFKALKEAKEFEVRQKQNKFSGVPLANKGKNIIFDEFWNTWFLNSNQSTEGWKKSQKQMYRDYIKPQIGSISLNQIKSPHVSNILNRMKDIGRGSQTRKHVYNLLRKVFEDCIEDYELISINPVKIKFLPKVVTKESSYLDKEEVKTLLFHVRGKKYGVAVWLQLFLGLRVGEAVYLKWSHVDFKNRLLHIKGTYRKKERRMVDHPKGQDHHTIKIPKELLQYLQEEKSKARSEWVQPSESNFAVHFHYKTYGDYLKKYVKEAKVNAHITSHCLRHSTHSILMAIGAGEEDMQTIFDHASPETTRKYIHGGHRPEERLDRIMDSVSVFGDSEAD